MKTNPPVLTFTDPPSAQVNGVGHGCLFSCQSLRLCTRRRSWSRPSDRLRGRWAPMGAYRKGTARGDHHVPGATKLWPAHRCMKAAWGVELERLGKTAATGTRNQTFAG